MATYLTYNVSEDNYTHKQPSLPDIWFEADKNYSFSYIMDTENIYLIQSTNDYHHSIIWPQQDFTQACLYIGQRQAFYTDINLVKKQPLKKISITEAIYPSIKNNKELVINILAHFYQALSQNHPLIIITETIDPEIAIFINYSYLALPDFYKTKCNLRIYSNHPKNFLEHTQLLVTQKPIHSKLGNTITIDKQAIISSKKPLDEHYLLYAKSITKRFLEYPELILLFSQRFKESILENKAQVGLAILNYDLVIAIYNQQINNFFNSLIALEKKGQTIYWTKVFTAEDIQLIDQQTRIEILLYYNTLSTQLYPLIYQSLSQDFIIEYIQQWWDSKNIQKIKSLLNFIDKFSQNSILINLLKTIDYKEINEEGINYLLELSLDQHYSYNIFQDFYNKIFQYILDATIGHAEFFDKNQEKILSLEISNPQTFITIINLFDNSNVLEKININHYLNAIKYIQKANKTQIQKIFQLVNQKAQQNPEIITDILIKAELWLAWRKQYPNNFIEEKNLDQLFILHNNANHPRSWQYAINNLKKYLGINFQRLLEQPDIADKKAFIQPIIAHIFKAQQWQDICSLALDLEQLYIIYKNSKKPADWILQHSLFAILPKDSILWLEENYQGKAVDITAAQLIYKFSGNKKAIAYQVIPISILEQIQSITQEQLSTLIKTLAEQELLWQQPDFLEKLAEILTYSENNLLNNNEFLSLINKKLAHNNFSRENITNIEKALHKAELYIENYPYLAKLIYPKGLLTPDEKETLYNFLQLLNNPQVNLKKTNIQSIIQNPQLIEKIPNLAQNVADKHYAWQRYQQAAIKHPQLFTMPTIWKLTYLLLSPTSTNTQLSLILTSPASKKHYHNAKWWQSLLEQTLTQKSYNYCVITYFQKLFTQYQTINNKKQYHALKTQLQQETRKMKGNISFYSQQTIQYVYNIEEEKIYIYTENPIDTTTKITAKNISAILSKYKGIAIINKNNKLKISSIVENKPKHCFLIENGTIKPLPITQESISIKENQHIIIPVNATSEQQLQIFLKTVKGFHVEQQHLVLDVLGGNYGKNEEKLGWLKYILIFIIIFGLGSIGVYFINTNIKNSNTINNSIVEKYLTNNTITYTNKDYLINHLDSILETQKTYPDTMKKDLQDIIDFLKITNIEENSDYKTILQEIFDILKKAKLEEQDISALHDKAVKIIHIPPAQPNNGTLQNPPITNDLEPLYTKLEALFNAMKTSSNPNIKIIQQNYFSDYTAQTIQHIETLKNSGEYKGTYTFFSSKKEYYLVWGLSKLILIKNGAEIKDEMLRNPLNRSIIKEEYEKISTLIPPNEKNILMYLTCLSFNISKPQFPKIIGDSKKEAVIISDNHTCTNILQNPSNLIPGLEALIEYVKQQPNVKQQPIKTINNNKIATYLNNQSINYNNIQNIEAHLTQITILSQTYPKPISNKLEKIKTLIFNAIALSWQSSYTLNLADYPLAQLFTLLEQSELSEQDEKRLETMYTNMESVYNQQEKALTLINEDLNQKLIDLFQTTRNSNNTKIIFNTYFSGYYQIVSDSFLIEHLRKLYAIKEKFYEETNYFFDDVAYNDEYKLIWGLAKLILLKNQILTSDSRSNIKIAYQQHLNTISNTDKNILMYFSCISFKIETPQFPKIKGDKEYKAVSISNISCKNILSNPSLAILGLEELIQYIKITS